MTDDCEPRLFEKARAGEHAAFDRLRALLEPTVRRFVRRLIGASDAEGDVSQDAFLALYMNLERIPSVESLRPFLFRVVRNRCYSELRRQGRFATTSLNTGGSAGEPARQELPEPASGTHAVGGGLLPV